MAPDSPIVLTILGMGTVFVVLAMIMFMIMIMGKILGSKPVPAVPAAPAAPTFNQALQSGSSPLLCRRYGANVPDTPHWHRWNRTCLWLR